jgi:hypothetical protein
LGNIIEICTLEETQALMAALQILLESDASEAGASPIEDIEPTERY